MREGGKSLLRRREAHSTPRGWCFRSPACRSSSWTCVRNAVVRASMRRKKRSPDFSAALDLHQSTSAKPANPTKAPSCHRDGKEGRGDNVGAARLDRRSDQRARLGQVYALGEQWFSVGTAVAFRIAVFDGKRWTGSLTFRARHYPSPTKAAVIVHGAGPVSGCRLRRVQDQTCGGQGRVGPARAARWDRTRFGGVGQV